MEVDALNSSHPVSTPVENPAQIREMFDEVSYDKVKMYYKDTVCTLNLLEWKAVAGAVGWLSLHKDQPGLKAFSSHSGCPASTVLRPNFKYGLRS